MDLVGTCPKTLWKEWLEEGDCAGEPPSGYSYCWNTRDRPMAGTASSEEERPSP